MTPALRGENGMEIAPGRQLPFRRYKRVNIRFKLPYYTQWGQNLVVVGSDPQLGAWDVKQAQWMTPSHEGDTLVWHALISVPDFFQTDYNYALVDDKHNVIKRESGANRRLSLPEGLPDAATVDIHDIWQDGASPENLLSKSAFKKVIFGNAAEEDVAELPQDLAANQFPEESFSLQDSVAVRFRVNCSRLEKGQSVFLSGSAPALGKWSSEGALQLFRAGGSDWQLDAVLKRADFPVRYKYILKDKSGEVIPEAGPDKELALDALARKAPTMIIIHDGYFRANPWRGAGIAVPVFSLRSEQDVGSGEYLDLKLVIDLALKSGLKVVQLLPVNDTSVNRMWWDSYPYSSLSVFALHPLYLRLQALSTKIPPSIKEEIEAAKKQLDLKEVDYDATMAVKVAIARKIFNLEKDEVLNSTAFKQYFEENKAWLRPYAAFCFLRDLFGTADHSQWGLFSQFTEQKLDKLTSPRAEQHSAIQFHYYMQFHLHTQLIEAADYARRHKIVLKGDLPIGVDRNSVDTWVSPNLFHMNASTGAPPDYFNMAGQNWGFPTYNWEEMSKDDYGWWRARLTQMSKYFTAYRIDHILGFFRIWELPDHAVTGLMGRFRPSIPLSQEELEKEGIWDFNRLSEPYVRCHLLQKKFGARWTEIASKYFDEYAHLCYQFKKEFNTEKKILADLSPREGSPPWLVEEAEETKKGLFDLMHEVVLIRDTEDPKKFYPRFGLEQSASYAELDHHSQNVLKTLYYDYFYHRQEQLWRENALKTLPVLMKASEMLACGEDLGMVPACVAPVLAELGLIGLRLQRMPGTPGQEFGIPAEYEYMTVCSPSCHDCPNLRAWWEEDESRRSRFFRNVLGFVEPPPPLCDPRIAHTIVQQHMESPSVFAIFPIQDFMALKDEYCKRPANEETINDPTNPRHYWRFRLHVTMESLMQDHEFHTIIKDLTVNSGRASASELPENGHVISKGLMDGFCGQIECSCYMEQLEKERKQKDAESRDAALLNKFVGTPEAARAGSMERHLAEQKLRTSVPPEASRAGSMERHLAEQKLRTYVPPEASRAGPLDRHLAEQKPRTYVPPEASRAGPEERHFAEQKPRTSVPPELSRPGHTERHLAEQKPRIAVPVPKTLNRKIPQCRLGKLPGLANSWSSRLSHYTSLQTRLYQTYVPASKRQPARSGKDVTSRKSPRVDQARSAPYASRKFRSFPLVNKNWGDDPETFSHQSFSDEYREQQLPRKKSSKRVMRLNPRDSSNKRFIDPALSVQTTETKEPEVEAVAISKNAQFRAIQPHQELLDYIEEQKLGRRRSTELRRSGYDLTMRAPIDTEFGSKLFTHKLVFAAAANQPSSLPQLNLPEVAFLGRSNVGKSSLLNALTRRWGVAWTSDKPGLTQTINFFTLRSQLCLVDLPGYGFAYAKEEKKTAWEELVKGYLVERKELKRVCMLVDVKWGLKSRDIEYLDLMESAGTRVQIVLTKTDQLFPIDIARQATQIQEALEHYKVLVQPMMMVSAETGGGIGRLRASLAGLGLQHNM